MLSAEDKRRLLTRLTEVEGLERYLLRAFLGQKSFSIEGLDVLVPMLDLAIELAAEDGGHEVVVGMAHRGRLNVLAHVIGRPYETILREFEGERTLEALSAQPAGSSGDVKYHLGAAGRRKTSSGEITVALASNPSHLEAVDPIVEGVARSEQTDRSTRDGAHDARFHLDRPFAHGRFDHVGPGYRHSILRVDPRLHRFWMPSGVFFDVAAWDWPLCEDWCWSCGDDFVFYDDSDHAGWYLLYNVHTGRFVHCQFMGS